MFQNQAFLIKNRQKNPSWHAIKCRCSTKMFNQHYTVSLVEKMVSPAVVMLTPGPSRPLLTYLFWPSLLWLLGSHLSNLFPCPLWVFLRFSGVLVLFFVCLLVCLNGEKVSSKAVPWPNSDSSCYYSALHWTQLCCGEYYFSLASDFSFVQLWGTWYLQTLCFSEAFKDR